MANFNVNDMETFADDHIYLSWYSHHFELDVNKVKLYFVTKKMFVKEMTVCIVY